jgi:hypothetical protein
MTVLLGLGQFTDGSADSRQVLGIHGLAQPPADVRVGRVELVSVPGQASIFSESERKNATISGTA